MATIQTAIQVQDRVSPIISNMVTALNHVISSFEAVERASGTSMNTASMQAARTALAQVQVGVDSVRVDVEGATTAQRGLNQEFQNGASSAGGLFNKIKGLVGMYAGLYGLKKGIDFFKSSVEGANAQIEAETKLTTVMRQRMGATGAQIQGIKSFTAAQQNLGVVGDEVQMAGAQQLATFLNTDSALKTLIPAMNNLAVQQNGVDATSENLISVGNMMGKVMQGQTGALTRVGVTFTEAQEQALKYGNEEERAAVLAQVITDNVGNMNAVMASTPAGAIKQLSNAWGDIKEEVGGKVYPAVMYFFNTLGANVQTGKQMVMQFAGVFSFVTYAISGIIGISAKAVQVISDNWSIIGPVIFGIIGILALYKAAVIGGMIVEGISKGVKVASTIATYAKAFATGAETNASLAATAAQQGLNAAILACPVTWIILIIIALIAIFYAVIAVINKAKCTTISATGVICGGINVAIQFVKNLGLAVANIALGIGRAMEAVGSNIETAFYNAISHVKGWWFGLLSTTLTVIDSICAKLNELPFVSFDYSGVSNAASEYAAKSEKAFSDVHEYENIRKAFDSGMSTYDTFQDGWAQNAYNTGYNFGQGIDNKVKGLFGGDGFTMPESPVQDVTGLGYEMPGGTGLEDNVAQIADNTGGISDSLNISKEDLKYMRDVAEREAINRYTTAQISVDFKNTATINSDMDIDGVMNKFTEKLREAVDTSAEEVHVLV